ncbi:MAG: hypothetical protein SFX18_10140 [Pirellulales bacterium]|nr:hypothetical protein [Pirellulales bacterium]
MRYRLHIPGFENDVVEIERGKWFTGPELFVNNQPMAKETKNGGFLLESSAGKKYTAKWEQDFFAMLDVPRIVIEGVSYGAVKRLQWYEILFWGLPLLLIMLDKVLGTVVGVIGFNVNLLLARSKLPTFGKWFLGIIVSVLSLLTYFALVALLTLIGNSW